MSFYEDEIIKDVEVGEIYTSKQIRSLLFSDIMVLCNENNYFNESSDVKYLVEDKMETYIHKRENFNYHFTNVKTRIYKVKLVR